MVRRCRIAIVVLAAWFATSPLECPRIYAQNRITGARPYVPDQTPTPPTLVGGRIVGARPYAPDKSLTAQAVADSAEPTATDDERPAGHITGARVYVPRGQPTSAPGSSPLDAQQAASERPDVHPDLRGHLRGRLIGVRSHLPKQDVGSSNAETSALELSSPKPDPPQLTEVQRAIAQPTALTNLLTIELAQGPPQSNVPDAVDARPSAEPQNTASQLPPPRAAPDSNGPPIEAAPGAASPNEVAMIEGTPPNVPSILKDALPRPVSLLECVHTSIASRRVFNSYTGRVVVEQLTAFEPQVADQFVTGALSTWDPTLTSFLAGNHVDRPPNSFFGPGISQNTRLDEGEFITRMSKIWSTGLTTSIGYEPSLAYLYFPLGNTSGFNPTHASDLVTRVNQPLLRGGNRNANLATLRVAQQRSAQSRLQVEAAMQAQLRSIEQVYWILHADHVRLRAVDEAVALAWRTRELVRLRYEAERAIYSDVARVTVALENLYQQRLEAEFRIRKSSFDLAQLVGLEVGENMVLVPIDTPERQPPQFNADAIVANAVESNLDLRRQRQEIDIRRQVVTATRNQRLPQLDLQALHRTSGLQNDVGSALHQMIGFEYNDYTLGLQFSQQLGYRQAGSRYRAAQLETAREAAMLDALERQVGFDVLTLLNQLKQCYGSYESAVRQLSEAQRWVDLAQARYEDPPLKNGESLLVLLLDFQTAVQAKVNAIEQVADRLAEFNGLLAAIGERRGNILEKWYIVVASDQDAENDLLKPAQPAPEAVDAPNPLAGTAGR